MADIDANGPMPMIRYQLRCADGHGFEAWFKDSKAYDRQAAKGVVECPHCGSTTVEKAIMAPAVSSKSKDRPSLTPGPQPLPSQKEHGRDGTPSAAMAEARASEVAREILDVMGKFRDHVEKHCENVGERFPEEARRMHYGETEDRPIYGDASLDDAKELADEGIQIMPLPAKPSKKN